VRRNEWRYPFRSLKPDLLGGEDRAKVRTSKLDWLEAVLLIPGACACLLWGWSSLPGDAHLPPTATGRLIERAIPIGCFVLAPCLTGALMLKPGQGTRRSAELALSSAVVVPLLWLVAVVTMFLIAAAHCGPTAYECPV
jgi:hypothetical protein